MTLWGGEMSGSEVPLSRVEAPRIFAIGPISLMIIGVPEKNGFVFSALNLERGLMKLYFDLLIKWNN